MKQLYFVTSNIHKFKETERWLKELAPELTLQHISIDLKEYQTLDVKEVAIGKAIQAWEQVGKPLLIDDGSLYFEKYPNFPGTFAKFVGVSIGIEGYWRLVHDNPRSYLLSCLVYKEGPDTHRIFEGIVRGQIIDPTLVTHIQTTRAHMTYFNPDGTNKTLAELVGTQDEQLYNYRYLALKKFVEEWRSNLR
jgi:XTP/dITP diphosphohydrolase